MRGVSEVTRVFPHLQAFGGKETKSFGEMSEWLKEHAWKVCVRKRTEGSNPSLSAINNE